MRELLISLPGSDEDGQKGSLLVYKAATGVEVVVTEQHGADASVFLELEQVQQLLAALEGGLLL